MIGTVKQANKEANGKAVDIVEEEAANANLKHLLADGGGSTEFGLESSPKKQLSASEPKNLSADDKYILKICQTHLFQHAKVITGPKMNRKACNFVIQRLSPKAFRRLEGQDLIKCEQQWIGRHENLVRTGINRRRNYTIGEVQKFYIGIFREGKEKEWPNPEEMYQLVLRQGMGKTDPKKKEMEKKFANYWCYLLVKTAGIAYWSDTKKCYGHISTYGQHLTPARI